VDSQGSPRRQLETSFPSTKKLCRFDGLSPDALVFFSPIPTGVLKLKLGVVLPQFILVDLTWSPVEEKSTVAFIWRAD